MDMDILTIRHRRRALLFVLFTLKMVQSKYSALKQIGLGVILFFISGPIV